jgi:hypothetical protein
MASMGRPSRTVVMAVATLGVVAAGAIRGAAAENLVPFARCLTHAGATYFRASWCPHCAEQERMFGPARAYLGEIDCSRPSSCNEIHSFPTWTFRNGARVSGVLTLAELGRRTGCPLPQARPAHPADDAAPTVRSLGGVKTREHTVGGLRVIDVP